MISDDYIVFFSPLSYFFLFGLANLFFALKVKLCNGFALAAVLFVKLEACCVGIIYMWGCGEFVGVNGMPIYVWMLLCVGVLDSKCVVVGGVWFGHWISLEFWYLAGSTFN